MRSLFASHSRSPLAFSHTHKHWRRGRRTRSRTRTASQVPQACCNPSTAALAALAAPPPRTRGAPSARPSPTLRQASPLRGSAERPSLPDAPESVGKQVFPSPRRSPTPFSFLPPFTKGPTLGMGTPAPLSLLSRRLCFLAALGRKSAGGPDLQPGSGARGVSASPGPRPPAAFLQARGEDRLPPSPIALAFSLSLALFCHWAARGGLRSSLQQRYLISKRPGNLESPRQEQMR